EDDENEENPAAEGNRIHFYKLLEKELLKCEKCGTSQLCKIDLDGNHVQLSSNAVMAWAVALAEGLEGVSLSCPPKTNLFEAFFVKHGTTIRTKGRDAGAGTQDVSS